MSVPDIRCPICRSALTTVPDADGRNLCLTCDESATGPSRSPDTDDRTGTRTSAREGAERRAGRARLLVVAAVGVLTVAGLVALRSNPPKEQAAADTNVPPAPPAPPRTPDPVTPTPPRQEEPSRPQLRTRSSAG